MSQPAGKNHMDRKQHRANQYQNITGKKFAVIHLRHKVQTHQRHQYSQPGRPLGFIAEKQSDKRDKNNIHAG